jgi:hypothetical protein
MILNQGQRDLIFNFCEDNDYRLRENYSGRFMYGSDCFGIVTEQGVNPVGMGMKLATVLVDNEQEELLARLLSPRQDNMGLGTITYWPDIQWGEGVDPDEDEGPGDDEPS